MTIPIEEARGRLMARIPQINIRMPQSIDHPLAFLTGPTVVSAFIRFSVFTGRQPRNQNGTAIASL
jgi:hypothetical protein